MHVFFFGDSLTLGFGDEEVLGWPGRLCAATRNGPALSLTPYNLGVRRACAASIRARLKDEIERRLVPGDPALVVLSFGVAEVWHGLPMEQSLADARALLEEACAAWPTLCVGPLPVAPKDRERAAQASGSIARLSQALHGLCDTLHIPYLEVYQALSADADYIRDVRAADGLHPTAAGYATIAGLVGQWPAWRDALHKGLHTKP
ncbi:hypothetical protein dsx2_0396 [Desulfovibrio sp. X2]|uniref:GDSL-type esterase/lipase family protein n=1 Tax=Desulfovibrio sp. X2 TaxID=941449 RepID=UPI000358CA39|nr:GDSL-type esterase/lipase family protein [Desulfovibrio sp. X2]EPR39822.1 hypothetical protein dsx2_0396 [Desulfovibrio sp. X2]